MDFAKFYQAFEKWELDNKVFDLRIDDVYVWYLVRNRVFQNLSEELGILDPPDYTVPKSSVQKVIVGISYLKNALFNLFKRYPKVDTLIFNHSRKVLKDNKYVDIYTEGLIEDMRTNQIEYLVMDSPLNWKDHLIDFDQTVRGTEDFSFIKKVVFKYFRKIKHNEKLSNLEKKLFEVFNTNGDLIQEINTQLYFYKTDYVKYSRLIKKTGCKHVYYVVKNNYASLIQACKDNNVQISEIQHGVMGKYNLVYNYPNIIDVRYFPNKMILFGKYWYDNTNLPIKEDKISYFEADVVKEKQKYSMTKIPNQVIFLSQPYVGKQMIPYLKKMIKYNSEFEYIYKLHPSEYKVWKEVYPDLYDLDNTFQNLKVVDSFEHDLNELLSSSSYAVGVNSTSLYEAAYYDCSLLILEIPGYELVTDNLDESQYRLLSEEDIQLLGNVIEKTMKIEDIFYEKEK